MSKKQNTAEEAVETVGFSREQLAGSKRFQNYKDLVNALLEDGVEYTIEQAEDMIQKYLKGKVN